MKSKAKKIGRNWFDQMRFAGGISLGVLILLVVAAVCPLSASTVQAEEFSTNVNTNVATLVRSSIAVAVTSKVNFDLVPSSRGTFGTGTAKLNVTTNNTTGYAVYLKTRDDSSKLLPAQSGVTESIGAVEGEMSASNFQNNLNTWGYAVIANGQPDIDTTYKAIPKSSDAAAITTSISDTDDSYNLAFGVAIGPNLPAGMYTNEVIVSAVANPIEVRSLTDITTMQEMTPEICKISYEDETKTLIDTRDGKSYTVTKLADGECWMTQNLGITFGEGTTTAGLRKVGKLTAGDSDLTTGREWTPEVTEVTDQAAVNFNADDDGIMSWNVNGTTVGDLWYYQWNTATAGSGQSVTGWASATDSICPKGWRLPVGGNNVADKSYYDLFMVYDAFNDKTVLVKAPLDFVKAGSVWGESVVTIGTAGFYWTASSANSTTGKNATYATFTSSTTTAGYNNSRRYGMSVRCVAK